jgi:hypothetical protein
MANIGPRARLTKLEALRGPEATGTINALTGEVIFLRSVIRSLRRWLVVAAFAIGKVARVTEPV